MDIADIYGQLPVLETGRLVLRPLRADDEDDIFQYCADEEVAKYTPWHAHRTKEDTRAYLSIVFDKYARQTVSPWGMVHKESGKLIGTTGFITWDTKHFKAELGYALSRAFWHQRYMSEAVAEVVRFGFERMELVRIEARCHPDNAGSSGVMEKVGMTFEGILRKHIYCKGRHEDVRMYSIVRDEFEQLAAGRYTDRS